jgi:predicted RNase H-like HicB family nuclease
MERSDMKFYTFEIVVEKEPEDEGYAAYSPTMPGCFSNGKTIEEARRNIRDAVQQHIESLLAHGQPIPQNENL